MNAERPKTVIPKTVIPKAVIPKTGEGAHPGITDQRINGSTDQRINGSAE
jgi:hypothetical protein